MRKLIVIILVVMLMTAPTFADLGYYTVDMVTQTEAVISGYTGGSDVVIPSIVDGVKVRALETELLMNKGITSIKYADGLKIVGAGSVSNNKTLTEVNHPDSVVAILNNAYADCGITKFEMGNGVRTIGNGSLAGNYIEEVYCGDSLTGIGNESFRGNNIKVFVLNDKLKYLGVSSLESNNLTELYLNDNMIIEKWAARGNKLTKLRIGSNSKVGDNAFGNTGTQTKVTYLVIGSNVELGNNVVNGDNAFKAVYDKYGAGTYRYVSNKWIKI